MGWEGGTQAITDPPPPLPMYICKHALIWISTIQRTTEIPTYLHLHSFSKIFFEQIHYVKLLLNFKHQYCNVRHEKQKISLTKTFDRICSFWDRKRSPPSIRRSSSLSPSWTNATNTLVQLTMVKLKTVWSRSQSYDFWIYHYTASAVVG
jgi:hypothetical protein